MADSTETVHILSDPKFESIVFDDIHEKGKRFIEIVTRRSKVLSDSLRRQQEFDNSFPHPERQFPFEFEFELTEQTDDEEEFYRPGATITNVKAETLYGDPVQFENGDTLLSIQDDVSNTTVLAPADAFMALFRHASDSQHGGIAKPLTLVVCRGAEVLEIASYYRFNRGYPWGDSALGAFFEHVADSALLGFWAEAKAIFSDDSQRSRWDTTQTLARQTQFFPRASLAGVLVGMVAPSPLSILKIGRIAEGRIVLGAAGRAVTEMAVVTTELAIYSYKTAPPTRSHKEIMNQIKDSLPAIAGISFVSGIAVRGSAKLK